MHVFVYLGSVIHVYSGRSGSVVHEANVLDPRQRNWGSGLTGVTAMCP